MQRFALLLLYTRLMYVNSEVVTCQTEIELQYACPDCCHGSPLTTFSNINSTISCGKLCSENPDCLSFQYKPDNKKCWTNRETMGAVNTSCSDLITHGEIKEIGCRPHRMFETCGSPEECLLENSTCLGGRCKCRYGYPYDTQSDSCPAWCAKYGYSLREVPYHLRLLNNIRIEKISISQCIDNCFSANDFVCRFIEASSFGECLLSEHSAISNPNNVVFGIDLGWKYFERLCG